MEVVKDFGSLIEIHQRPIEDNMASDNLGPDVELEIPVSMIEDNIKSKEVVKSQSNAFIEAQDQRPIEDNMASDVAMEVVKDFYSLIVEKGQRPIEDNKASDNRGPDVKMEDAKDFGKWFGNITVPVNEEFSTASPIIKVHNDDHSMDVDNREEFQSRHPPSIISEKRQEIRDSFNEDETVYLVNTSFSSVTNPYDLKVSLSNRIREIKAICAHFKLDFESLSSGGGNGCSGLDMSIIESKEQDHSDSVSESGSDKLIDVDLTLFPEVENASSFASHVPAVSDDNAYTTSCPIALSEFNEKAIELNFLELLDMFPMEEGSFVRFGGHNPFCSASITVFEHSIRLYLMTLHSQQQARNLNRKSTGGHYAILIMEHFDHLKNAWEMMTLKTLYDLI
jgi:hypothetical protein